MFLSVCCFFALSGYVWDELHPLDWLQLLNDVITFWGYPAAPPPAVHFWPKTAYELVRHWILDGLGLTFMGSQAYQDTKLACFHQLKPLAPVNSKLYTKSNYIGVRARTPCTFWDNCQFCQNCVFCVNKLWIKWKWTLYDQYILKGYELNLYLNI